MNDVFITYRHFRLFDDEGSTTPKGGATLAFFVDLRDPEDRKAIVGYAICSNKDHFSKAVGRELAYFDLNFARRELKDSIGWSRAAHFAFNSFVVGPKEDDGTLCTQLLSYLDENHELITEDSAMYTLVRWLRKHNII